MKKLFSGLALIVVTLLASACTADSVAPLPAPPVVSVAPTSSSVPDFSAVNLPVVDGKTIVPSVNLKGGQANINGLVTIGGAPTPNAIVHVERLVGDKVASTDLTTNADGRYSIDGLEGGRYRVRAYRPPDATMAAATVFFLGINDKRSTDLQLTSFGGGAAITAAIAPSPPILGQPANLVVSLTTRGVDSSGIARAIPSGGVPLSLVSAGGRVPTTPAVVTTDGSGRARWTLTCVALDSQGLSVLLPDGTSQPVNVAGCSVPPPTTTVDPGTLTDPNAAPQAPDN